MTTIQDNEKTRTTATPLDIDINNNIASNNSNKEFELETMKFMGIPDENGDQDKKLSSSIRHGSMSREQWNNKIEYMLSVIGYVVDLGNCVRFPYVTYKNGGGAFLIPYFTFLLLIGVPMMYLEMSIGQYFRVGNIKLWELVHPYMKGIGYASLICVSYITLYYSTIIAYSVYYLFASFAIVMPWSSCSNEWNTEQCFQRVVDVSFRNKLEAVNVSDNANTTLSHSENQTHSNATLFSPSEEYFNRHVLKLHLSTGIHDLGYVKLDLAACLALVFILMYVCVFTGVKSTGKAVYVTATLPYIILLFLLFHGVYLEGARDGILYFITPTFEKLFDFSCWKDAAIQIFFTLGPGISVLTTYSSYSKFSNNCQIDAISACIANVIASFLAGFVVFASLGHLSHEDVAQEDLGLSFIAYPEILSTFRFAGFFSFIFFLMIFTLGLDSCFGGLEAIYAALADEFAVMRRYRKLSMAVIHLTLFLLSLPTVTYGGMYLITFLDTFSTSPALMLIVFFEAVSVSWFYGMRHFKANIKEMFNIDVSFYFKVCWQFITPTIIFSLFVISVALFEPPQVGDYKFPPPYLVLGWLINVSVMLPIPVYVVYKSMSSS